MNQLKKQKWSKNRKRIFDALKSNAYNNQTSQMLENFIMLRNDEFERCKNSLLYSALKNSSKECAEILIEKGAYCDTNGIISDCHWSKLDKVHSLIGELLDKHGPNFTSGCGSRGYFHTNKRSLIARLIEPSKIEDNPDRLDYTIQLLRNGFFNIEDIRSVVNETYKDSSKRGKLTMLIREITLNDLGI